jgi:hypothetical protein
MVMGFLTALVPALSLMTYFVSLKIVALVIGLFYIVSHLPGALAPHRMKIRAKSLPRSYFLGVVLMLAATIWFVCLTGMMDLGELSNMRVQLMTVWSIAGILVVIFVPAFLAVRGAGCLALLAAALILDATFLVQTPARYVLTLMAYGWVIGGMALVYSPHLGRDALAYIVATPGRCRFFCWAGVAFGVILIALGAFIYP